MLRTLEYATSADFSVYFICSPGDDEQIESCRSTGYTTWVVDWEPGRADFARKINWAFPQTSAEWLFQGADDIRFSPGWDVEAFAVAEQTGASVIGTNDLHNPSVKAKLLATHIFFARSYIDTYGGTFDGTGAVFSETYDHQFVDNEFVALARARKQWAFAEKSIVEHLHPVWGLADWDPVYEKAFRETSQDQRLHARRMQRMQRAVAV